MEPENESNPKVSEVLNPDLYPDLVQSGGLASAILQTSQASGIEVGVIRPMSSSKESQLVTAEAISNRGPISILLGAEKRWFSISIEGDVHPWASGGTADLLSVARVIGAWRKGVKLKELNAHFPFMQYDELAQSYENGDPVATQWGNLLTDEMFSSARGLLRQIHSDDQLRKLFPFFSHGTLRLARDYSDRTAGEIWITPLRSGGYRIESTDSDINREEVESTDQIIDIALSLLGRP